MLSFLPVTLPPIRIVQFVLLQQPTRLFLLLTVETAAAILDSPCTRRKREAFVNICALSVWARDCSHQERRWEAEETSGGNRGNRLFRADVFVARRETGTAGITRKMKANFAKREERKMSSSVHKRVCRERKKERKSLCAFDIDICSWNERGGVNCPRVSRRLEHTTWMLFRRTRSGWPEHLVCLVASGAAFVVTWDSDRLRNSNHKNYKETGLWRMLFFTLSNFTCLT